jgi:hypothetical protein
VPLSISPLDSVLIMLRWRLITLSICMGLQSLYGANLLAQSVKPHPWIADAPGEFVRLIDAGNVRIEVDDETVRKSGKSALTVFKFDVDYNVRFRFQTLGFDRDTDTWSLRILAWFEQNKLTIEHKVCISSRFTPIAPWETKLLQHEFDHVAVSTDPRLLKIVKRALQERRNWTETLVQVRAPTEDDVRKLAMDKYTFVVRELEQLVQSQYDSLDKISDQGRQEIDTRVEYFWNLYTVEGLEKCHFEVDDGLRKFIKDKLSAPATKEKVESHYLFRRR